MKIVKGYIRPLLMVLFAFSLLFVQRLTFSGQAAYKSFISNLGLNSDNIAIVLPMLATGCLLLLFILPDEAPSSVKEEDNN
ncbi:hypothetical protein [Nibrella saemangeumensis]